MRRLFTLLVILHISILTFSQGSQQDAGVKQKRLALLIGNGNYPSNILSNPENDARAIKKVLEILGFDVLEYENLDQGQMKKAIDDFGIKLKNYDVGLFFYAGHGIQTKGYNYLIPIGVNIQSETQVEYDCVQADRVVAFMEESGAKVKIIILDACRNNPFERSWTRSAAGRGLATMNAPSGTLIAYSTSPGNTAQDGNGNNSPYTTAILESIQMPDLTITQMFQNVTNIVLQTSGKQQTPWISSSLTGDFYFNSDKNMSFDSQNISRFIPNTIKTNSLKADQFIDERDGQIYRLVKIGTQVWMAENLKATKFSDSTSIRSIKHPKDWMNLNLPGFFENENGVYYNWYAVNTRKLCPAGWHVPNEADLSTLFNYLGGESIAGDKLKEIGSDHWNTKNYSATDEVDFTALPFGYRSSNGQIINYGYAGYWWRASIDKSGKVMGWSIYSDIGKVFKKSFDKSCGFSVRCIKDN